MSRRSEQTEKRPPRRTSLRSRGLSTTIVVMVSVVVVGAAYFVLAIASNYISSVQTGLVSKAQTATEFFTSYVSQTYTGYYQSASHYAESFDDKDTLELQFVSTQGRVEVSSYGISAGATPGTQDIALALQTGGISAWRGRSPDTGEQIMAVSAPIVSSDGSIVGVMRYVTSMRLVHREIWRAVALASALTVLIITAVVFSNLYFISTITEPILELTGMARRIADGSYGIQAEKKRDDEIGGLIDSINEMSVRLAQAERVQTEFVSSVSHELRTPLTAITGWSETLMYSEDVGEDSMKGVEIISKEAKRLTKMVEDLLEFTRIQDGRFSLNIKYIDITAELEECLLTYGERLKQDEIELTYRPCHRELPPIRGDAERLKQVFLNILDNAAKYGRSGKKIVVSTDFNATEILIYVRDFGPGIPPDELPRIKEKFYKGSSKERGSGIGLAVCDEIVTRHMGKLTIMNAVGGGTRVVIALPREKHEEY